MREKEVLDAEDIRRALVRIAHEIVERNHGADSLLFVGVLTRGLPLARRLADHVAGFEGAHVPVGA